MAEMIPESSHAILRLAFTDLALREGDVLAP